MQIGKKRSFSKRKKFGKNGKRRAKKRSLQELFLSFAILSIVSLPALAIGFTSSVDRTSDLNTKFHYKIKKYSYNEQRAADRWPASMKSHVKKPHKSHKQARSMLREKW